MSLINANATSTNSSGNFSTIPEIHDGEKCEEGKLYRQNCNLCRCTLKKDLKCTKRLCVQKLTKPDEEPEKASTEKKKKLDLPDLPSGLCDEGKFYKKGCRKCFCEHDKKAVCAAAPVGPKCKLEIKPYHEATPEDYGVKTNTIDITKLPSLPNISTKCDPGHTYRVDCNICICLANKNLLCTSNYCLSIDDMNRVDAKKRTGLPCNKEEKEDPCIKCRCIDEKLSCEAVKNCQVPTRKRLHGTLPLKNPRYPLSLQKGQECVPKTIYKIKCNRCYCQDDGALRCTAMTCLNYVQALSLQKSSE